MCNYILTDDQGCFSDIYVEDIEGISDCFDRLLPDYIDRTLEDYGFEYDDNKDGTYYQQAYKWIKSEEGRDLLDTDTFEVIEALVNQSIEYNPQNYTIQHT